MSEKKKINYFGSAYHNDYQGKFTGYSLVVSLTQLEDAKEWFIVVVVLHEHFGDLSSLRFDERVLKFLFTV